MEISGNKISLGPIIFVLGFFFLFFIMFNPLALNVDSLYYWLTHLNFYSFTQPEVILGIGFILIIIFLVIVGTNLKDNRYKMFNFVPLPVFGLLQDKTQTIHEANNYNPLSWFGQAGNEIITIILVGMVIIGILLLLSGRSKKHGGKGF